MVKSRNVIWTILHLIWEDLFLVLKNFCIQFATPSKGLSEIIPGAPNLGLTKSISSDPAFVLQGLNLVPFPPSKRDALGAILSSCRDEGKDPALVFSMICYDGKVLCMCQVKYLRVVQTTAILFLKSMSESVVSDIERLWNGISRSTQNRLKMTSIKLRVVLFRIRLFPTLISKIKWLRSELPLSLTDF